MRYILVECILLNVECIIMVPDLLRFPQRTVNTLSVRGGAAGAQCFMPRPGLPQGGSQVFRQVVRPEHGVFRSYGHRMVMSKQHLFYSKQRI